MSDVMMKLWATITVAAMGVHERLRDEKGQSTTEYVVILAAIVAIAAGVFATTGLGGKITTKLNGINL